MEDTFKLKLMTYNIGGGRKDLGSDLSGIMEIIRKAAPDILGIQEATEWSTLDKGKFSQPEEILRGGLKSYNYFFGPTLTMSQHFHVQKELFIYGLFNDWTEWQQGNALFSRWPFVRFGDSSKSGQPQNIPINRTVYLGSRDTDPRYALLGKIDLGFAKVFTLVTHLTTLNGERPPGETREKRKEAQAIRLEQCERILDLVRTFILEKNEVLILLGDFNATPGEPAILSLLETKCGFVRLVPSNRAGTHLKVTEPVDHILIYPGNYHIKYSCEVVDDNFVASDHNPVVAEISLHNSNSKAFKAQGAGVFQENVQ